MIITIFLVILIFLLLGGWGHGYRSGKITSDSPIGLVILLLVVLLVFGIILGPNYGLWRRW